MSKTVLEHSERVEFMKELYERIAEIFQNDLKSPEDWVRVKTLVAEAIAKTLAKYAPCVTEVYLIELSGGEPVDLYEGGLDIDLYVKTGKCADRVEALASLVEEIVKEALVLTKDYAFVQRIKGIFGKGLSHNLVEFHINKEYLEPLIRSRYHYKQRLYP